MRVSLHLATSFDATWEDVLLPWFEKIAPQAFQQSAAVAVVTPFRSHAQLLRGKLLAHGTSLLGVRFLVPAQLRDFLLRDSGLKLPLREHLRLLLATAAEEYVTNMDSEQSGSLIARAVARDPDRFLRALDELRAAGLLAYPEKCRGCRAEERADREGVGGPERAALAVLGAWNRPRFSAAPDGTR